MKNVTSRQKLEVKVKAINKAHACANEVQPKLVEVFRQFIGQKVERNEGGLMVKVQKLVDALKLPNTNPLSVYRNAGGRYSISYSVKVCEWIPDHVYYHETTFYVGETNGAGTLEKVVDQHEWRTDYTAEEIENLRKVWKKAKREADNAHSRLEPFGEYEIN